MVEITFNRALSYLYCCIDGVANNSSLQYGLVSIMIFELEISKYVCMYEAEACIGVGSTVFTICANAVDFVWKDDV